MFGLSREGKTMKSFKTITAVVFSLAPFFVFFAASAALPQSDEPYPKKNEANLYGYADANGEWVIEPRFLAANPFSADGTAWVRRDKAKYASIDKTGKVLFVLTPDVHEFASVSPDGVVIAKAVAEPGDDRRFSGLINEKGWIAEPAYFDLKPFPGTDLFQALDKTWAWSFLLNKRGEVTMTLKGEIFARRDDVIVATVEKDGRELYGLADMSGNWIVWPKYDFIMPGDESDYMTVTDFSRKTKGVIDGKGNVLVEAKFNDISPEPFVRADLAAAADSDDNYGFIDRSGEWAIEPQFARAENFSENGLAVVGFFDGTHGFIDAKGEIVIAPEFADARGFDDRGLAPARASDGKWGLIKENGEWAVPPLYDDIPWTHEIDGDALYEVRVDGAGLGLINGKGDIVVPPSLSEIGRFDKRGFCLARTGDSLDGFIDATGKWLIEPLRSFAKPFGDDDYTVVYGPGRDWGLIDRQGNRVLKNGFREVSFFGNDLAKVIFKDDPDDDNFHYLNFDGEARVPVGYDPKRERR
jgi:hypothetical protein